MERKLGTMFQAPLVIDEGIVQAWKSTMGFTDQIEQGLNEAVIAAILSANDPTLSRLFAFGPKPIPYDQVLGLIRMMLHQLDISV